MIFAYNILAPCSLIWGGVEGIVVNHLKVINERLCLMSMASLFFFKSKDYSGKLN